MEEDAAIMIFLGLGALVVLGIIVGGVLSSRRKKAATSPTFTVRTAFIGEQPFLESSDIELADKRQEELFRLEYPIGSTLTMTIADSASDAEPTTAEVHVARIGRGLRSGYPLAKLGLSVYFREWEGSEFPTTFALRGAGKVTDVTLDHAGVRAVAADGSSVWSAPWESLLFSNGPDIMLSDGAGRTVRFPAPEDAPQLEELLIKYGTLKQMHF